MRTRIVKVWFVAIVAACGSAGVGAQGGVKINQLRCPEGAVPVSDGIGWVCGVAAAGGDKVVFVTSQLYSGRIGGVSAADLKCQTLAETAGLPGEFRAWLSSASRTPDGHFRPSARPYRLVDGTLVANDWNDLLDEEYPQDTFLRAPIDKDEHGVTITGETRVWTGTRVLGNLGGHTCNRFGDDWWTDDPSIAGDYAWATHASFAWTELSSTGCNEQLRLYCFQQ